MYGVIWLLTQLTRLDYWGSLSLMAYKDSLLYINIKSLKLGCNWCKEIMCLKHWLMWVCCTSSDELLRMLCYYVFITIAIDLQQLNLHTYVSSTWFLDGKYKFVSHPSNKSMLSTDICVPKTTLKLYTTVIIQSICGNNFSLKASKWIF